MSEGGADEAEKYELCHLNAGSGQSETLSCYRMWTNTNHYPICPVRMWTKHCPTVSRQDVEGTQQNITPLHGADKTKQHILRPVRTRRKRTVGTKQKITSLCAVREGVGQRTDKFHAVSAERITARDLYSKARTPENQQSSLYN